MLEKLRQDLKSAGKSIIKVELQADGALKFTRISPEILDQLKNIKKLIDQEESCR